MGRGIHFLHPLKRGKIFKKTCVLGPLNFILWLCSSSGALVRLEYPFITITPGSTLPWSVRTCYSSIYGSNIKNRLIGLLSRMFANGLGDLGSIPDRVIPKTFKIVLDTFLLNTQQYKIRIKGKVEHFRERSSALLYTLV